MSQFKKILNTIKEYFFPVLFVCLFFVFVSFAEKSGNNLTCNKLSINFIDHDENNFLDKNEVIDILVKTNGRNPKRQVFKDMNLFEMEKALENNNYIENAEIYSDLSGELSVDIEHRMPVLRIISAGNNSYYLDKKGKRMPLSPNYTSRTLVATGYSGNTSEHPTFEKDLFMVSEIIRNDNFLKALIGQIYVNFEKEIILVPKVEDLIIVIGNTDDIQQKFKKLKIFYKQVLPVEGWNKYDKVDLRFKDQIVLNRK